MASARETQLDRPLSNLEKRLLNDFQDGFPLTSEPFADIANQLGVNEAEVIAVLKGLRKEGLISRVGPVFRPNRVGASTLAAMAVPPQRLEEVAELVNACPEVNHNYEREHEFNLWFVATAPDRERLQACLDDIERRSGIAVMDLPMLEDYFINLGFPLQWT
jgi:DNA-binding Lrp family transcriptional regulator